MASVCRNGNNPENRTRVDPSGLQVPQILAGLVGVAFTAYVVYPWVKSVIDHYRIEHTMLENAVNENFESLPQSQNALACQNQRISEISIITPLAQKVTFTPSVGGAAAYDVKMLINGIVYVFKRHK